MSWGWISWTGTTPRNCSRIVYDLLKPGGQVVFYESNPWNVVLKLRRVVARLFGGKDPRRLLSRPELYELISEIGFIRIWAVFNDFVYRPLTRSMAWVLRNLSILLENMPVVRTLAGSILVQAQKPPRDVPRPRVSLFEHEALRHSVSVVIPCHNEEMNIGPLVTGLRELFGEYLHEIILVDDNSTDATRDVIGRLASEDPRVKPILRTPPNGVGRALADGYRAATGEWVLSMDCDFQHLLPEVRDLFDAAAEGFDVVVGSRFSRHSVLLNYPFQKIVANRGFHLLAQLVLLRRFRDLTNNLKLMRREVAERLRFTQPGFAVNAETGLQPLLMGCKIKEVPISWINRTPDMGMSSFHLARVGGGYCPGAPPLMAQDRIWPRSLSGRGPYRHASKDMARARSPAGGPRLTRTALTGLLIFAFCALIRIGLVERHGLWVDEFFSLAMATGHSLEHPADRADPALGDYVEAPRALPPAAYSRYLEHDISGNSTACCASGPAIRYQPTLVLSPVVRVDPRPGHRRCCHFASSRCCAHSPAFRSSGRSPRGSGAGVPPYPPASYSLSLRYAFSIPRKAACIRYSCFAASVRSG